MDAAGDTQAELRQALQRGVEAQRAGDATRAAEAFREAARRFPDRHEPWNLLGIVALRDGRGDEALAHFDTAARCASADAAVFNNRGAALERAGRADDAERDFAHALALDPRSAPAATNLARLLRARGRPEQALAHAERAVSLAPAGHDARFELGNCLTDLGRAAEALEHYRRAVEIDPRSRSALTNLGNAHMTLERYAEAAGAFRAALDLAPDAAPLHNNLALALAGLERVGEARQHYEKALALDPDDAVTHYNFALLAQEHGRPALAVRHYRRAIELRPQLRQAYNNLGNTLKELGRHREAFVVYREALRMAPDYPAACSNLLCSMNYEPSVTTQSLLEEHRRYGARLAAAAPRAFAAARDPARERLRIGYVSPDFKVHSVGYFMQAIVAGHDRGRFEVWCYSDVRRPDAMTGWFRARSDHWREVRGWSDETLAQQIVADGVDVLVDLAGHTAGNRLPVFARRCAPVQVTYLGYCNTTGVNAIDYRLTDAEADPPGAERQCTETLLRLAHGFLCYTPPAQAPPVAAPPALAAGRVTFGSFNDLAKINDEVIALWSRLLKGVPDSHMYLKTKALFDPQVRAEVHERFAAHGVEPPRVRLSGWNADIGAHLAEYANVDVALDTFPYCGTTTTCEALWMGVPVVTLAGERHAGRVGVSINTRAGLTSAIASSPDDYVAVASRIAADRGAQRELRFALRERMRGSPLCDGPGFTRRLEAAYLEMWNRARAGRRAPG